MVWSKKSAVLAAIVLALLLGISTFIGYTLAVDKADSALSQARSEIEAGEDQRYKDLISVCESGNRGRVSELGQRNDLIKNAKARKADPATHEEGKAALQRARKRKQQLIDSVTYPVEKGSVRRDCERAYDESN